MPLVVILLGITSFFTDVGTEMIFPLLPVFLTGTLKAAPAFLGLIEGASDTVCSLLKLASGRWSDRLGRRKPLVASGYALAGLVRPLVGLATAPWHVLAVRLTDRVGKGLRSAPRDAMIAAAAEPGREGRAFGFHRAMDHAGAVVGPLVASALLAAGYPLRQVFLYALVPGVLAFLAMLCIREPPVVPRAPAAAAVASPALSKDLRAYLLILGLFSLGNASDAFLLLRAHELGLADAAIPVLWSVFHVSKLLSSGLGGEVADRVSRPRLVVVGWGVYAVAYLGFALASQPWHAWALFIGYGVFYGLTEPAEKALVKQLAPAEAQGRAFGWYNFVVGIAALPAGLLTGAVWTLAGPAAALGLGAVLAAVAGALLLGWERRRA